MRKRIGIAALAITIVSVLAYMLSQPKEGTLEWHKKEYRNTRLYLDGYYSLSDRFWHTYMRVTGRPLQRFMPRALFDKMYAHEKALLEMGFLAKRVIPQDGYHGPSYRRGEMKKAIEAYARIVAPIDGPYDMTLIAPPNDLPRWEKLLQRDVPETSK